MSRAFFFTKRRVRDGCSICLSACSSASFSTIQATTMADNRLRCALVYRLDAGDETSVTMLAKYDHASQYETSPGGSDLYGGRDKSYADAVGMVIGNDPPGATSEAGTIGGFKVCQSEVHQVVYGSDTDGLCKFLFLGFLFACCTMYVLFLCRRNNY